VDELARNAAQPGRIFAGLPDFHRSLTVRPSMSDRLAELARQRALVQEHLAWLDREIADAARKSPANPAGPASPASLLPMPNAPQLPQAHESSAGGNLNPGGTPVLPSDPDAILTQYRVAPGALKEDVRKGCFLYFAIALVVLALGVGLLYVVIHSP
jgi:hypothetical protein